jgi:hypothetical protein
MKASHSPWDEQVIIKPSHVAGIHQLGHSLWLMAITLLSLSLFSAVSLSPTLTLQGFPLHVCEGLCSLCMSECAL